MRPVERHLRWLIVALFLALGLHGAMAAASAPHPGAALVAVAAASPSHDRCCDEGLCGKLACCNPCNAGLGLIAEPVALAAPPRPIDGIESTPMPRGLSLRPPLSPPREPVEERRA